jgi:hypothetical protein
VKVEELAWQHIESKENLEVSPKTGLSGQRSLKK